MLLDRLGPPGFRFNDFRAPRLSYLSPLRGREGADGQAGVCPLLRGSSPTRGVAPKQHRGLRRAFSPAFFGLVLFIPWRVGAEEAGAAKDAIMAYGFGGAVSFATTRSQRRDAARPARASPRPDRHRAMRVDPLGGRPLTKHNARQHV